MALNWTQMVMKACRNFAARHQHVYSVSKKAASGLFELGCFHALIDYYRANDFNVTVCNLKKGEFKYLTTPAGNPSNFSFVEVEKDDQKFEIRQQIRVMSYIDERICFTPDIVVLRSGALIQGRLLDEYANKKKQMFSILSSDVLSLFECKSMQPYPELFVSFIGYQSLVFSAGARESAHLPPTLFVGGSSSPLHLKMIGAFREKLGLNIIDGMHYGDWKLYKGLVTNTKS